MPEHEAAAKILTEISGLAKNSSEPIRLMEVCGTHTVAIFRSGIRQLLPENIRLVSGPGCPVCVTPESYIDKAVAYGKQGAIIATFGDMLKVPGSAKSLGEAEGEGIDARIVYSPLDALRLAEENSERRVIFLSVGFETTTPTTAATLLAAKARGIKNLLFLAAPKLVPPVLKMLLSDRSVKVDGFLLPGHVAMITGSRAFEFLPEAYHVPAVVTGFSPLSILRSILCLTRQITTDAPTLANEYKEAVSDWGNATAQEQTDKVYEPCDAEWRGIGFIPSSGLKIRDEFAEFDIEKVSPLALAAPPRKTACRCGDVLKGVIDPPSCPLFGKVCSPWSAVGPCMVSAEGVCAAWYKYGNSPIRI